MVPRAPRFSVVFFFVKIFPHLITLFFWKRSYQEVCKQFQWSFGKYSREIKFSNRMHMVCALYRQKPEFLLTPFALLIFFFSHSSRECIRIGIKTVASRRSMKVCTLLLYFCGLWHPFFRRFFLCIFGNIRWYS